MLIAQACCGCQKSRSVPKPINEKNPVDVVEVAQRKRLLLRKTLAQEFLEAAEVHQVHCYLCSVPLLVSSSFSGKNQAGRGRNNKVECRDKVPVKGWKERRLPSTSLKASGGRGSLVPGAGVGCCCEQVFCFVGHKVDASVRESSAI